MMKTEATTATALSDNAGDTRNNARVPLPKTPMDACIDAINWSADDHFQDAMGMLMKSFMNHGPEAHPELQAQVQQLIDRRLAVTTLVKVFAALPLYAQTQ